jgi:uncharacterized protein (TIGR02466 family)
MVFIKSYFPSLIGVVKNLEHSLLEKQLINKCFEIKEKIKKGGESWISNSTYNTLNTYNIFKDEAFKQINEFTLNSVLNYCDQLNIDKECLNKNPIDSWVNIYNKNDYQEFHIHSDSIISTVYFLAGSHNGAKIYFKSPNKNMIQIPYTSLTERTFDRVYFKPEPGMLLIFNSNLEHSVEKHITDDLRISIACNFSKK